MTTKSKRGKWNGVPQDERTSIMDGIQDRDFGSLRYGISFIKSEVSMRYRRRELASLANHVVRFGTPLMVDYIKDHGAKIGVHNIIMALYPVRYAPKDRRLPPNVPVVCYLFDLWFSRIREEFEVLQNKIDSDENFVWYKTPLEASRADWVGTLQLITDVEDEVIALSLVKELRERLRDGMMIHHGPSLRFIQRLATYDLHTRSRFRECEGGKVYVPIEERRLPRDVTEVLSIFDSGSIYPRSPVLRYVFEWAADLGVIDDVISARDKNISPGLFDIRLSAEEVN